MDPEVAVTVTLLVPAGVPGLVGAPPVPPELPPPPQPINPPATASAMASTNHRPQPAARFVPDMANKSKLASARSPGTPERAILLLSAAACGAVVVTVKVVVAALAPGVTVDGAKVQLASEGRPLLHAKVTACAKPPAGVTESVAVPLWPGVMERLAGLALTVKEAGTACTVTVTALDVDPEKFGSPPYTAVSECVPAARLLVL